MKFNHDRNREALTEHRQFDADNGLLEPWLVRLWRWLTSLWHRGP